MTALYLSGPMAGYADNNFPAFQSAFNTLTEQGHVILSPHHIAHPEGSQWVDFLRRDLSVMLEQCHGIVLLKGWPQSKGARLELTTALALDWPVYYFEAGMLVPMNRAEA